MRFDCEKGCTCACGRRYGVSQWKTLQLVRLISADEAGTHVVGWPGNLVIEVRACARCERQLSRIRVAGAAAAADAPLAA